jgi:surface polysaccharide O-acyltransferase-like enzyme
MPENGATASRAAAVDVAKLAAAAAVVWIHVTACEQSREFLTLCRFAVPFFTAAAAYFVLCKALCDETLSILSYSMQRARRLYLPFLIWGVLYLAVRLAKQVITGSGSPIVWSPALLLNGSTHHLWFLPFVCFLSIAAYGVARHVGMPSPADKKWWALALALMGAAFAMMECPVIIDTESFPLTYFIDHGWDALPSIFFGAVVFLVLGLIAPGKYLRWTVLFGGVLCLAFELFYAEHPLTPHLAGAGFLFVAITQPDRDWMKAVQPWAELAFIIYLIHVVFVEGLQTVADRFGGVASLPADISVWALSCAASAITAKFIQSSRHLQWLTPR